MKKIASYRALIRGIEKVYFKVSLIVLHKRMDNYHKHVNHSHYSHDIKSSLLDYSDTLDVNDRVDPEVLHAIDCTIGECSTTNWHAHEKHHAPNHHHLVNRRFRYTGELSQYFKARRRGSDLHPEIKEKLVHSVWDHIHATIRLARQGDDRNSKMHADIASSACKELAHYMKESDYQAFVSEVKDHLNRSSPDSQREN